MLEALEQVDWRRLDHAYGSAQDVPDSLHALRSPDPAARRRALGHLFNTIAHQGSRYRASAPAVPFLYEVLEAHDTPDRHEIVELLERRRSATRKTLSGAASTRRKPSPAPRVWSAGPIWRPCAPTTPRTTMTTGTSPCRTSGSGTPTRPCSSASRRSSA